MALDFNTYIAYSCKFLQLEDFCNFLLQLGASFVHDYLFLKPNEIGFSRTMKCWTEDPA